MSKQKYYVVWKGQQTGVFDSWNECQESIKGFNGARFKSFNNKDLAFFAYEKGPSVNIWEVMTNDVYREISKKTPLPILKSISVDAACSGNPGLMEYQGVYTITSTKYFAQGPFEDATVNLGEFLAICHALAQMQKDKLDLPVYSDSLTAMNWLKAKKVNTKLARTQKNQKVFEYISRALTWLRSHQPKNQVLKWDTGNWGEIPADYGRK